MKKSIFQKIQDSIVIFISKFTWTGGTRMPVQITEEVRKLCVRDYYIITTRRANSFAAFFISLGTFIFTGKWGYYTHILMNTEDVVINDEDFRFVESTTKGTHYSTFDTVIDDINGIALFKPKGVSLDEWTAALDSIKVHLGKPYDNLFNVLDDQEINCIELVRITLKTLPDYDTRFANFEALLRKHKTLTPHMIYNCPDFERVYEVRYP